MQIVSPMGYSDPSSSMASLSLEQSSMSIPVEDPFGIVYVIENRQQFWSGVYLCNLFVQRTDGADDEAPIQNWRTCWCFLMIYRRRWCF